jgi:hypothetical protein
MIKAREWPVRAMYILIAVALALSLFITAAPAHKVSANSNDVTSEWDKVPTPTTEDWVLAPGSTIIDYALASEGDVAYAVVHSTYECPDEDYVGPWYLLKSTDGAATWKDITKGVKKVIDEDKGDFIDELLSVATDWESPDFVAVALWWWDNSTVQDYVLSVFFSADGGVTFNDGGEVEAGGVYLDYVSDLAVSPEVSNKRDIAIGGMASDNSSALFRCTVTGDSPGAWKDATAYDGWDDDGAFNSTLVTDILFAPSWADDNTILAVTVTSNSTSHGSCEYWRSNVTLQSGIWGKTSSGWNEKADFEKAVIVTNNVSIPAWLMNYDARGIAGVTVPSDYAGTDPGSRYAWVWVNYYTAAKGSVGEIFRVIDDAVDSVDTQISKMPWLTNVSYLGSISEGEAIAGLLANWKSAMLCPSDLIKDCCEGVQVYHNDGIQHMEICCQEWEKSCKPPTGQVAMAVSYASDDKAYAVALQGGMPYDEGAWSVAYTDSDFGVWNQLSLIDTYIDYLSDVAVSPDCNKMMIVSVNGYEVDQRWTQHGCGCDSVWLFANDNLPEAPEYTGKWIRTWCGQLTASSINDGFLHYDWYQERGLLRLAPEETNGDTVYLVDRATSTIYYNDMETWNCWKKRSASSVVDHIVDLAVKDESTIYVLDDNGDVAMSDDHGATASWSEEVESKVDEGYTIAVHGDSVLVGGRDGDVGYSSDGGETFALLEETPKDFDGLVTVAFDTYFDTNNVIYAALAECDDNGIYRWVIGTSTEWKDLNAEPYDYTGLVLSYPNGNTYTSADTGGVLYASYIGFWNPDWFIDPFNCFQSGEEWMTGVARCLTPAGEISCEKCVEWDYLTVGLPHEGSDEAFFRMVPYALKACGCMDPTTNTELFAIGKQDTGYDMCKAEEFTVWTFEDCYAKKAPDITAPADGYTAPADCNCNNLPFSIKWDAVCDACVYDVQIALDDQFTDILWQSSWENMYSSEAWYIEGGKETWGVQGLGIAIPSILVCQTTYYYRVRAHQADTCQVIHSQWSDVQSVTVAPSVEQGAITLIAPVSGSTNVATKNVGFSWTLLAAANKFDWVLSANADLSSPVDSQTVTTTATSYAGTLSNNTTYYWQVTAYQDSTLVSTSAIGTFRTVEAPAAPVTPTPTPTPPWVWVVIAIGAVLVIVVIVLIFRTRRV